MNRDFWKDSGASLRESETNTAENKRESIKPTQHDYSEKNSLYTIRQLENAYGKYAFGLRNDKYVIEVSRKSEFKEAVFENSREKLNENRLNEKKVSGGRILSDSHKKDDSAFIYEESVKNSSPERIFINLKQAAKKENKLTLNEMFPEREDIGKKVFQSLKASVEAIKNEYKNTNETPFFKRAFNYIIADENEEIDSNSNMSDE